MFLFSEESELPRDLEGNFMVDMVSKWEESAHEVVEGQKKECRVATVRIGLVLGVEGGMLQQLKWQYFFGRFRFCTKIMIHNIKNLRKKRKRIFPPMT